MLVPAPIIPPGPLLALDRRALLLAQNNDITMQMKSAADAINGWAKAKARVEKKMLSRDPTVDFGVRLGGLVITNGRVSKIDVRDGKIKAPLDEVSQYRRFCRKI